MFSNKPEGLELDKVCLFRVEAKLCRAVAVTF